MFGQLSIHRRAGYATVALLTVVLVATSGVCQRPVFASDLAEQVHSLRQAPADSAFYSSSLRLKEQWNVFRESNAYDKLMQIPLIQLAKGQASIQWQYSTNPQVAQIREYLESPAGRDARAVMREMWSDEVFAYGGSSIVESIKFLMEANRLAQTARKDSTGEGEDREKAVADKLIKEFTAQIGKGITVPTVVLGFRIKDMDRAKRSLDEVHSQLRNLLDKQQPDLSAHLQRDQIAGHEFLTLRLDGSMIPWDKIREESDKIDEEQFNSIREALSKQTLAVALGVSDEFVLLSVGPTTDHLQKLGQGSTLAEQPAISRLQKHADQKVVSLTYVSKSLAESFGSAQKTMDDIVSGVEQALEEGKVDEEDRKTILDDIRSFNLAKYMPEPAESSAIAFLTARGYEAFQYTPAKRPMADGSKPLAILSHVGGNPWLMIAGRSTISADDYNQFVTWLKRIAGHAEKIAEKKADADDWAKYQKYRDRGIALLERFNTATREKVLPALTNGERAFVMDLAATSQQWFNQMPESPKPLPMIELALVTSVRDGEKLQQGVKTYVEVAKDAYKLAHEIQPDDPEIKLPEATSSEISGGKLFTYALPEEWGIDPQVAVSAGITDKLAIVSFMPKTTERLFAEQKANLDTSLPIDQPAALVTHIEFAKFVDATRPWIDYGLDVAMGKLKLKPPKDEESDDSDEEKPTPAPSNAAMQLGFVVPQLQQFLDVATTLRSATTMSYEQDGVWITHSETHIEDLK